MAVESMTTKETAAAAYKRGDLDDAKRLYSEILDAEPSALIYAKRGMVRLSLGDQEGAVADATDGLLINPDCALAMRVRGEALAALGDVSAALRDVSGAQALDYDEKTDELHKELKARAADTHWKPDDDEAEMPDLSSFFKPGDPPGMAGADDALKKLFSDPEMMKMFQQKPPGGSEDMAGADALKSLFNNPEMMKMFQQTTEKQKT